MTTLEQVMAEHIEPSGRINNVEQWVACSCGHNIRVPFENGEPDWDAEYAAKASHIAGAVRMWFSQSLSAREEHFEVVRDLPAPILDAARAWVQW